MKDLVITHPAIGELPSDDYGIALANTTAAQSGAQQYSPPIRWQGAGWKTNTPAASETVDCRAYVVPVQGTDHPTAYLLFEWKIDALN